MVKTISSDAPTLPTKDGQRSFEGRLTAPSRPSVGHQFLAKVEKLSSRLEAALTELDRRQKYLDRQLRELAEAQLQWRRFVIPAQQIESLQLTARFVVTFRTCTSCGQLKPLEEFYLRPSRDKPERRHRQCRDCMRPKKLDTGTRG
jgi:hypothetical protein